MGIALYTLFVGGDPAVFRAAILGGLALFAAQIGRRQAGLNSLALAALVMAALNPQVLWDVGFQLSFAATLGLVLYAEPLTAGFNRLASRWLARERVQALSGPVSEYLLMTLAAQITTLPVILYHFQRLSLSAFVTNPLILPAQPPVMTLGGLAVMLGLVLEPSAGWRGCWCGPSWSIPCGWWRRLRICSARACTWASWHWCWWLASTSCCSA